jgi:hypothetical protein
MRGLWGYVRELRAPLSRYFDPYGGRPRLLITCVCLSFSLCVCLCVCALGVGAVGDEYDDLHNHDPKPQEGS